MRTPLALLVDHLADDGTVPLFWAVAHAETWPRLWDESRDPAALLSVARVTAEPRALVAALCACVRLVLARVPAGEPRGARAVETAEAFARGDAATDIDAVRAACTAARLAAVEASQRPRLHGGAAAHAVDHDGVQALLAAAGVGDPLEEGRGMDGTVYLALRVLAASQQGDDSGARTDAAAALLADRVRAVLPRPPLEALLARSRAAG